MNGARGASRGRGVRTRGGGSPSTSSSARGASRGRGGKMRGGGVPSTLTSASDVLVLFNINDLPIGVPMEVPLWPKRQRKWSPPRTNVHQPSPEVEVKTEVDPLKELNTDVGSPAVPWPAIFVPCATDSASGKEIPVCSGKETPVCSGEETPVCSGKESPVCSDTKIPVVKGTRKPIRKKRPLPRRSLDLETEVILGSESDSDEEEVEGAMLVDSTIVRRVDRAALDTPLDEVVPTVEETIGDTEEAVVGSNNFCNFQWTPFPNPPIPPGSRRETFSESNVGPVTLFRNPYDVFAAIWDPKIMEHIAKETNRYAQQLAQLKIFNNDMYPRSRINTWQDLTADDIWVYFALVLAMGIVVKSQLQEYWSADADIFVTPGFRIYMSLRKFQLISSCLHFNNNEDMCSLNLSSSEAKLYKIQPILDHLQQKFQTMYVPKQNIALDESLLMWKGWLDINQFIQSKVATVGIKTYEICESQTGYLWRFEVHASKSTPLAQQQTPMEASTPAIVLRLTHGLENKGYTLCMDNYFNSPALARKLKTLGFDCVGTLRTNRQFVPQELNKLTKANMTSGQITGYTSGDVDIMVWKDLNRVAMISTYHGNATASVNGKQKPILILDYNVMMGGVDKKDQMLAMYPIERKRTRVWYKKFFRRLLNVSVLNSYIILKQSPLIASSSLTLHRNFRTTLIKSILDKHNKQSSALISVPPLSQNKFDIKCHHLAEFGFLPGGKARNRRQCAVCKKRVHLFCEGCQKPFCMNPCFVSYHS